MVNKLRAVLMAGLAVFVVPLAGATELSEYNKDAMKVTQSFVTKLGEHMTTAMKFGGAEGAVQVCRDAAPRLTGDISRKTGWKVTRVGTRVRNSMLGMPDSWEQNVLIEFEQRKLAGEDLGKMFFSEVVDEPNGKYFRFMKAIPVKKGCLQCHGNEVQIKPAIAELLKQHYPHDLARGYKTGDLRGAVSIKRPL